VALDLPKCFHNETTRLLRDPAQDDAKLLVQLPLHTINQLIRTFKLCSNVRIEIEKELHHVSIHPNRVAAPELWLTLKQADTKVLCEDSNFHAWKAYVRFLHLL